MKVQETPQLFDTRPYRTTARLLRERFVVPPFSILDASQHYWQARKANWLSLGIESELGRDVVTYADPGREDEVGRKIAASGYMSVFDPVLCELVYRWWSPMGGVVLDPFAGGSVRGVVAAILGRRYFGTELRGEQVAANQEQADRILPGLDITAPPRWNIGDSRRDLPSIDADLIFSCPPYGDLEVYSDDPRDLSAMSAPEFEEAYVGIIRTAAGRLRKDRFAVFTVGNYRDKRTTAQVDLVGLTIDAFADAGLAYYSDSILATVASSHGLRASRFFGPGRKPARRHQYVLTFVKGDWRKAAEAAEPED